MDEYKDCKIVNIRRGNKQIIAELRDKDGKILVSATLDYIVDVLNNRLPAATKRLTHKVEK
jgi:phosphoserine phosphatase